MCASVRERECVCVCASVRERECVCIREGECVGELREASCFPTIWLATDIRWSFRSTTKGVKKIGFAEVQREISRKIFILFFI